MQQATTIGLDLAKNVFQIHGVDDDGRTVVRRKLRRSEVEDFFRAQPSLIVGMEACGGAYYWGACWRGWGTACG